MLIVSWIIGLLLSVYLVQCASGTTFKDLDGDGIDDVGAAVREKS